MPCKKANLGYQIKILGHEFKKKVSTGKISFRAANLQYLLLQS